MKSKGLFVIILLFGFCIGIYYHYLLEQLTSFHLLVRLTAHLEGESAYWNALSYLIRNFFTILFTLSIILISSIIVLENRNPSKTVAWLVILTILPIIGFIFYIFVGRNVRKRRRYKHKIIDLNDLQNLTNIPYSFNDSETLQDNQNHHERIINLLFNHASSPMTKYNQVKVLTNGRATFETMLNQLSQATDHIHLISFIIRADDIGSKIKSILIEKAKAGVEVRVIVDGLGSWELPEAYIQDLRDSGVEFEVFSPVFFPYLRKVNYRNHRKIMIVDGKVGFVGGLNIGDEYLGKSEKFGLWRDTHMMVQGDSVYFLQMIFLLDWRFTTQKTVLADSRYFPKHDINKELFVQIAASGPDSDWEYIQKVYFSIITNARKKVFITTPYLIPDDSILMALKTAALSGVDVRIMVPGIADHLIVFWASRSYFTELLEAGVRIFIYDNRFIHAKIMVADAEIVSLGTANFDIRSFHHNFEVNGIIYDADVADCLEEDFISDLENCTEMQLELFNQRSLADKAKESIARLTSPLL